MEFALNFKMGKVKQSPPHVNETMTRMQHHIDLCNTFCTNSKWGRMVSEY